MPKPSKETLEDLFLRQGLTQSEIGAMYGRNQRTVSLWMKQYGIETGHRSSKGVRPSCDELREMYETQGLTKVEIGQRYGFTAGAVALWLAACGIDSRGSARKSPIPQKQLAKLVNQGLSFQEIGQVFDRTPSGIHYWIHKYGIMPRSQSEALRGVHGHKHNRNFFKHWSPEMAWVLGLMFSDGNVTRTSANGYTATLTSIDKDLLEQVAYLVDTEARPRKWAGKPALTLIVGAADLCEDLIALGCVPTKSRIMQFPNVPPAYVSHFVRGLWDGDGSIFTRTRKRDGATKAYLEVTLGYVCGSREFVQGLRDAIFEHTGVKANIKERKGQANPYYVISYYHRNSLLILPWMYSNSTPQTRLGRKYEVATLFLRYSQR